MSGAIHCVRGKKIKKANPPAKEKRISHLECFSFVYVSLVSRIFNGLFKVTIFVRIQDFLLSLIHVKSRQINVG